jgi:hypothetical protein
MLNGGVVDIKKLAKVIIAPYLGGGGGRRGKRQRGSESVASLLKLLTNLKIL